MARAGLRTPESVCLPHETFRELGAAAVMAALIDRLGPPADGQAGARAARRWAARSCGTAAQLPAAMVNAFAYGDVALLERFVDRPRGRRAR